MMLVMKMSPAPNMLVILVKFPIAVSHQEAILLQRRLSAGKCFPKKIKMIR
jgi:hypothetical protein